MSKPENSIVEQNGEKWAQEIHNDILTTRFKIKDALFYEKSDFQTVEVFDSVGYGKMLINDGLVMTSERDEFIYHEMIAHVPLFTHPNPKSVLIIGGGDGGTAREVLKHKSVTKIVNVEIDGAVVEAAKKHLLSTSVSFSDPKVELIIDDGINYVRDTKEKFDVVLVDSTDPVGPSKPLFGMEFYRDVHRCLTDDGIVIAQAESPFYFEETQNVLLSNLSEVFPISTAYNFTNLTYPGGLWTFAFASKKLHPIKDLSVKRVFDSKIKFSYYNAMVHSASFALPQFMLDRLSDWIQL